VSSFEILKGLVEQYLVSFFQALASNLNSNNSSVKKATDTLMFKLSENVSKQNLVTALVS